MRAAIKQIIMRAYCHGFMPAWAVRSLFNMLRLHTA